MSWLTILRPPGQCLTKIYALDMQNKVTKSTYDKAFEFQTEVLDFEGVDGLAELLKELEDALFELREVHERGARPCNEDVWCAIGSIEHVLDRHRGSRS